MEYSEDLAALTGRRTSWHGLEDHAVPARTVPHGSLLALRHSNEDPTTYHTCPCMPMSSLTAGFMAFYKLSEAYSCFKNC